MGERCKFQRGPGQSPAANAFLVYLQLRERIWLLQMSLYFCWTKSENRSKCCFYSEFYL